mmetsp:Transcript_218/g.709  ORF Transcript_218/g.709 Transcript_218/m.709 type:complete len:380 (+) Transcript_218:31-1170(+)
MAASRIQISNPPCRARAPLPHQQKDTRVLAVLKTCNGALVLVSLSPPNLNSPPLGRLFFLLLVCPGTVDLGNPKTSLGYFGRGGVESRRIDHGHSWYVQSDLYKFTGQLAVGQRSPARSTRMCATSEPKICLLSALDPLEEVENDRQKAALVDCRLVWWALDKICEMFHAHGCKMLVGGVELAVKVSKAREEIHHKLHLSFFWVVTLHNREHFDHELSGTSLKAMHSIYAEVCLVVAPRVSFGFQYRLLVQPSLPSECIHTLEFFVGELDACLRLEKVPRRDAVVHQCAQVVDNFRAVRTLEDVGRSFGRHLGEHDRINQATRAGFPLAGLSWCLLGLASLASSGPPPPRVPGALPVLRRALLFLFQCLFVPPLDATGS